MTVAVPVLGLSKQVALSRLVKTCQDLSRLGKIIVGFVYHRRRLRMSSLPAAARTHSSGFQWLLVANDPEKTFKQAADHIIYRPIRKTDKHPWLLWQHSSVTGPWHFYWYLKSVN